MEQCKRLNHFEALYIAPFTINSLRSGGEWMENDRKFHVDKTNVFEDENEGNAMVHG